MTATQRKGQGELNKKDGGKKPKAVKAKNPETPNRLPKKADVITISRPKIETIEFALTGTAPYVQHKFSAKAIKIMGDGMKAGSTNKKGKKREARDFKADFIGATYRAKNGKYGMSAPAFRNAMISACRMAGFKMTHAKLSVFVMADGYDAEDNTPLVFFTKGKPKMHVGPVRNANSSCDLRSRPMWNEGWQVKLRVQYDADQFTATDVANLLMRAGMQVGVGEGRPDSKNSCGMGWGLFSIESKK